MEDLADRIEIVCLDPGALADPRHPDRLSLIRDCLAAIDARWPERLPVILAGHGRGGMLALALADSAPVQGVVALAPIIASLHEQKQHDLASRIDAARIPLLAVFHDDVHVAPFRAALERSPLNTVVRLPGDGSAALTRPIATFVAEWSFAAVSGRDCSSRNILSSSRIGLDGA
ncbi:MAG: alpha/beta hydrolase [Vicinamibacteria bacterium]|nr:alpha/beta hydrolase [Vicinamibacteria bacterium]